MDAKTGTSKSIVGTLDNAEPDEIKAELLSVIAADRASTGRHDAFWCPRLSRLQENSWLGPGCGGVKRKQKKQKNPKKKVCGRYYLSNTLAIPLSVIRRPPDV